jgi:CAAX protease family protein
MRRLASRHPLASFFALTFLLALPFFLLAGSGRWYPLDVVAPFIGSGAIAFAALLVARLSGETAALRQRAARWKVPAIWYLASVLLPTAIWFLADLAVIGSRPVLFLFYFLLFWLIAFLEEVGWRGFALPHLLAGRSALTASILLGLVWILLHAPLYWGLSWQGLLAMVYLLAPVVPLSIILTWLFLGTGGSVPVCSLCSALFTTWGALLGGSDAIQPMRVAVTALLLTIAAVLVIRNGTKLFPTDNGGNF